MKKFLMFLAPLLIAVFIFLGILFFTNGKSGKGALQVTANPRSKIYLDNRLIGATPFCACDLTRMVPIGDYTIRLIPDTGSFSPYEAKITINKSTLTVVDKIFADNGGGSGDIVSLIPLSDKKEIEILVISIPDKANVFLDSNPVGVTPLLLKQVSESDHDLRLTKDGYQEKSIRIKTALGFKLSALVFLGIKTDLASFTEASASAATLPIATVPKVTIQNTPTGFLRVRENNSITSSEVGKIKPGESYELISERESWFEIKLNDGKTGWISSQYAVKSN